MIKRNFDEMISYFNRTVADMDIDQQYKMVLLGIVVAIGAEHDAMMPVRCKDCKHWDGKTLCDAPGSYVPRYANDFCSQAERREDG